MPRCRVTPTPEGRVRRRREHIHDSYRRSGRPAGRSAGGDPTTVSSCAQACEDTNHPDRSVATATVTVRLLVRARRRRDVRRGTFGCPTGSGSRATTGPSRRAAATLGDFLEPYNKHLSISIIAIYRVAFTIFGFDTYAPLRIAGIACFVAVAVAALPRPAPTGRPAHRRVRCELHAVVPRPGPRARAPQPLPGRARWHRVRVGLDARRPYRRLGRRGRARLCADRCGRRALGDRRVLRTRRM